MEAAHRKNLRLSRQKIVDDLDVSDVIDHLLENSIVDEEDYQRILAEKTRKARARSLLDLLAVRGPRAYPVFVAALQESYSWLAAGLEVGTGCGGEEADSNDRGGEELVALLTRGGVPHPPALHIPRTRELQAVRAGLAQLQPNRFLTLHGMPGSGKSVLAAESVRDPQLTLNNFPGGVFWFKVFKYLSLQVHVYRSCAVLACFSCTLDLILRCN